MNYIASTDFSGPIQGILVAAIVGLCGVIRWLFKDMRARMDADKLRMESEVKRLDTNLASMQTS